MTLHFLFLELFPVGVSILFVGSYVKQIVTTLRTKDVTGIDTSFWVQIVSGLVLRTSTACYVFSQTGGYMQILMEFLNLTLAAIMLVLVINYRKKD